MPTMEANSIVAAIYGKLAASGDIGNIVWSDQAPIRPPEKYIVVRHIDDKPQAFFSDDNIEGLVDVSIIVGRKFGGAECRRLAGIVFALLHKQTISGIFVRCVDRGVPLVDGEFYRLVAQYRLVVL